MKRPKFVIVETYAGLHVVLQGVNGEPLMSSEVLESEQSAQKNIRAVMDNAPRATIEYRSEKA